MENHLIGLRLAALQTKKLSYFGTFGKIACTCSIRTIPSQQFLCMTGARARDTGTSIWCAWFMRQRKELYAANLFYLSCLLLINICFVWFCALNALFISKTDRSAACPSPGGLYLNCVAFAIRWLCNALFADADCDGTPPLTAAVRKNKQQA